MHTLLRFARNRVICGTVLFVKELPMDKRISDHQRRGSTSINEKESITLGVELTLASPTQPVKLWSAKKLWETWSNWKRHANEKAFFHHRFDVLSAGKWT
jgi:hypothetical protein